MVKLTEERQQGQGQSRGSDRRPAYRSAWPAPGRPQWPADDQSAAHHEHQMRRADQGLEPTLDAKREMPGHVEDARDRKEDAAEQGERIAVGERPPPFPG